MEGGSSSTIDEASVRLLDRGSRPAWITFTVLLAISFVVFLRAGASKWFFLDEWDFLAGRSLTNVDDLLRPHNEHWTTIPLVLWRLLWETVGLRWYWPYQLLSIVNHLAIAALLRVVMRRAGVGPWIATIVVSVFVLFGAGIQNVLSAFQFVFAGALTFGLIQLLLADHDGDVDRRDWFALAAGLAAIMTSGVGTVMVLVVGVSTLLKRGWRIAAMQTVPLAAVYGCWWLAYGRDAASPEHPGMAEAADFVATGFRETFVALTWGPMLALLLAATLVAGLALAWWHLGDVAVRQAAASPLALLFGGVVFMAVTGWGRAGGFGAEYAKVGRYLHLVAAFTLPALAVAIDALYRRWQVVGWAALALLAVGVPANVRRTLDYAEDNPLTLGREQLVLSLAHDPRARTVPRTLRPLLDEGPDVTVGWLIDNVDRGVVPEPEQPPDARLQPFIDLRLGLHQVDGPATARCERIGTPVDLALEPGDVVDFEGVLRVTMTNPGSPTTNAVTYRSSSGSRLVVVGGPLSVRLSSPSFEEPAHLCE